MKTSHPLYRISLYLYPASYRREYGDQMVQTLQDMLDDAKTPYGRTAIWLRVAIETLFSVLKENINSIGENSMNKLTTISNKHLLTGGLVALIVLGGVTFDLWRNAIIQGTSDILYGNSLRSAAMSQNHRLNNPFVRFTDSIPKQTGQCSVGQTRVIQVHVDCQAAMQAYTKLGQSAANKSKVLASAQAVTNALKAEGYQGGSNGITLMSLVAGAYEGKDYSPDAFYQKRIGKDTCTFDTTIAYSNPSQPAINMSLNCDRTVDIFGKPSPSGRIYYSE